MNEESLRVPGSYDVVRFDEIDSTNAEALRLAASKLRKDTWVVARSQVSGRGRRGRRWVSERGNLYASLLIYPRCDLGAAGGLTFLTGIALLRACAELAPDISDDLKLKWPNDLLLNGKKIAGILLESSGQRGEGQFALVIGCGVNCSAHPKDLDYPVTDLKTAGFPVDIDRLFEAFARHFDELRHVWREGAGFDRIRDIWLSYVAGLGLQITVRLPNKTLSGIFEGIDSSGQLILRDENGMQTTISAGDVFFERD